MSNCRSCGRSILWAKTAATGKPMPLDEDDERGNVLRDLTGAAHVFKDTATAEAALEADNYRFRPTLYISHHAEGQCPKGPEWRGKQRGDVDEPKPEAPAHVQDALPL